MRIVHLTPDPDVIEYAIGDIHGYAPEMEAALLWCSEDAARLGKKARVHLLGDYVDRGPDSRRVLEILREGPRDAHVEWLPIRGNHDETFARVWFDHRDELAPEWWARGGQQTLMSYGWNPLLDGLPRSLADWVPEDDIAFIRSMPLAHVVGDLLFVHAGVRPGRRLEEQSDRDLMWIRSEFARHEGDYGHTVVHGHIPDEGHPKRFSNRIAMDGGVFFTGRASVAAFEYGAPEPRFETVRPAPGPRPETSPRLPRG